MSMSPERDPYGRAPLPRYRRGRDATGHRDLAQETEEIHIRPPLPRRLVAESSSIVPKKEKDMEPAQREEAEVPSQPVQLVHLTLASGKEVLLKSQARSVYDAKAKGSGRQGSAGLRREWLEGKRVLAQRGPSRGRATLSTDLFRQARTLCRF